MLLVIAQGDAGSALVFSSFIFVLYRDGLPGIYMLLLLSLIILSILSLLVPIVYLWIFLGLCMALSFWLLRKSRSMAFLAAAYFLFAAGYVFSVDYGFNEILKPHQRERINVLLGKDLDLKGAAYNLNQSKIAIGSGGLTGKGFLKGTQTKFNFVPEQSTDFIFCTVGEEGGFLGSTFVLILIFGLIARVIFISERQRSKFTRIYGYGVASVLFFHVLVNVGMTMGLMPVMGIPFPFLSYGGSSILGFTILLFILLKLDSDRLAVLR
jgi:rod shape determining protein RodA